MISPLHIAESRNFKRCYNNYIIGDKTLLHVAWRMTHLRDIDELCSKSEKKDNLIGMLIFDISFELHNIFKR